MGYVDFRGAPYHPWVSEGEPSILQTVLFFAVILTALALVPARTFSNCQTRSGFSQEQYWPCHGNGCVSASNRDPWGIGRNELIQIWKLKSGWVLIGADRDPTFSREFILCLSSLLPFGVGVPVQCRNTTRPALGLQRVGFPDGVLILPAWARISST